VSITRGAICGFGGTNDQCWRALFQSIGACSAAESKPTKFVTKASAASQGIGLADGFMGERKGTGKSTFPDGVPIV
jgi:hypothetical protein